MRVPLCRAPRSSLLPCRPRPSLRAACLCLTVQGSQAYAKALAKAGVLTAEESATIVEGLAK